MRSIELKFKYSGNFSIIFTFSDEKSRQIAAQLVEKGADVNVKDAERGETILMRMCRKGTVVA